MKQNSTFFTWLLDGKAWCDLVGRGIFIAGVIWIAALTPQYYKDSGLSKKSEKVMSTLTFWK